jgi:hypothetical protein
MRNDRLITIWVLVICTILGLSLAVAIVVYGPSTGVTAAAGFLAAKLIARLGP